MIRILFLVISIMSLGVFTVGKREKKEVKVEEEVAYPVKPTEVELIAIHFCGDTIPLQETYVARRYQNMIKSYDNPTFRRMRARSRRDMKVIEPILKRYGIPSDFKYVPIIESAMSPSTTSPRGAAGYWQFMPETARSLGLTVDETVDERNNLVKSTHAACKYLRRLHRQLGSWTLVAAAYNAGPTRIQRRMDEQGKEDYYDLRLNPETTKYVFKLVAVKEWFTNPTRCLEWTDDTVFARVAEIDRLQKVFEEASQKVIAEADFGSY
ncbi:hypothetical protein GCM10027275_34100 [Rhabdobacter roseus]